MEIVESFSAALAAGPQWVFWWVNFMGLVFVLAIPVAFFRPEGRWTLISMAFAFPAMMWLYSQVGFVRLLGIVHVVFWTPLAFYLWQRRNQWRVKETLVGKWILLLFATIVASLIFDYTDVLRYALSERG